MRWSPSTSCPVSSTASTRSASPSNASPTAAPRSTTRRRSASGWVEPASALMLRPSGSAWSTSTEAPRRRRASGAKAEAAPLAQSMTTSRPSRVRPSREATTASSHSVGPGAGAEGGSVATAPGAVPASSESRMASSSSSTSSASLRPPAAKNFTPLSLHGLWDAESTAPGTPRCAHTQATAGVGTTPRLCGSAPPAASPPARAASSRNRRHGCPGRSRSRRPPRGPWPPPRRARRPVRR